MITDMYPGTRPLAEFESALMRVAVDPFLPTSLAMLRTKPSSAPCVAAEAARIIADAVDSEANIISGLVVDEELGDEMKVTVIATGFDTDRERRKETPRLARVERRQPRIYREPPEPEAEVAAGEEEVGDERPDGSEAIERRRLEIDAVGQQYQQAEARGGIDTPLDHRGQRQSGESQAGSRERSDRDALAMPYAFRARHSQSRSQANPGRPRPHRERH